MIIILKRIICCFCVLFIVTSFFVVPVSAFDINDYIEVEQGDIPSVNTDIEFFDNQDDNNSDISHHLDLNEEYYNEDHLVDDEIETDESFESKAELHTSENSNSTNSYTKTEDSEQSISDDYGIMPLSDEDYDFSDISVYSNWSTIHGGEKQWVIPVVNSNNAYYLYKNGFSLLNSNDFIETFNSFSDLFTDSNLIIFRTPISTDKFNFDYVYIVYYVFDDIYFENNYNLPVDGSVCFWCGSCFYNTSTDLYFLDYCRYYLNEDYIRNSFSNTSFLSSDSVIVYSGGHKAFYNGVELDIMNDDGFINGNIKGEFNIEEKSKILNYKAYSDVKLDKTYDVHLWALDNSNVPIKITGNEIYPVVDLDNYTGNNLKLSPTKTSVQASIDLESVYYYLHQMKGYDDSLESVDGYNFTEFDSRENLNFVIAYRVKDSPGDWIVCKSYQYNYGNLIENAMGSFTVKKDYVDFPDMSDYIYDFPSFSDYLSEVGGDNPGILDYMVAGFHWVGDCVVILGDNIVGFFKWLFDCIPVIWDNLTIALYNLVCDLKSLFLYLFNPKSKSIMSMAEERLPGFSQFINAIQSNSTASLPEFTFFGTKFTLDLSQYDLPWHYLKSFSQILIMIMFAVGTYNLVAHVFGFVKLSGIFDSPADSDDF